MPRFRERERAPTQNEGILPADWMTTWNPGLDAVGGVPYRTTITRRCLGAEVLWMIRR
jgi:hypothetical protein